ncbi:MAG: hypothetical protein FJ224_01730 [Lentisphaerae bacterium]|nr:hypothetical protein [Lentisphaerota bacterium]
MDDRKPLDAEFIKDPGRSAEPSAAGSGSLPRLMDPVITMGAVQRYVEQERMRSRRLFVWTGTVFLFILLFVLTTFIAIGLFVVRHTKRSREEIDEVRLQTAVYSAEVLSLSNVVVQADGRSQQLGSELREREASRHRDRGLLQSDLRRFSAWVNERDAAGSAVLQSVIGRMERLDAEAVARQEEVASLREQNAALLLAVAQGGGSAVSVANAPTGDRADLAAGPVTDVSASAVNMDGTLQETARTHDGAASALRSPSYSTAKGTVSVVTFPNGDRYEGGLKGGLFEGWGVYYRANGDRYEGEFRGDMKNGNGTIHYANGDIYTGQFEDDRKQGRGSYTYRDGNRYVGDFFGDALHGSGIMVHANGNQYTGEFKNGAKHGRGTFTYGNGDSYTGQFAEDARNGSGTYVFANGDKYVGEFKSDRREGLGRYIYANGEEYEGEFLNGMKHGQGVCRYPNGQEIKVLWKNDRFVGVVEN